MRKAGIIGGMSWESSALYYSLINKNISNKLGGLNSAELILASVNFEPIEQMQKNGNWEQAGDVLVAAAVSLETAGADFVSLATNTMHKVAQKISEAINIPFIHIADATAEKLKAVKVKKIGLLGTAYTMNEDFYKGILIEKYGIDVIIPKPEQVLELNRIIFEELCMGRIEQQSKKYFLDVITSLAEQGAQGVILGCTEIGILIKQTDTVVPIYDTTLIHTDYITELMLK